MKILFAGTPDSAALVLKNLSQSGHEIVAVLTREDALVGRNKVLTPSAVAATATELGLGVIKANKVTAEVISRIQATGAELGIVVAYGSILSSSALTALPHGWYNLHYSLLPKYRGAAPVQWALVNGDTETGITLFKLNEGMDTGPILATLPVLIGPDENAGELINRLSELGSTLLNENLPKLYSGGVGLVEQSGEGSLAPKPTRTDARIDYSKTSIDIENLIRGMNPEPMAWCLLEDQPFRVLRARAVAAIPGTFEPGTIIPGKHPTVSCGDGTFLELLEVQPSSKKVMAAADWFRGSANARFLG